MTILVTGAAGQLGGELCRQLGNESVGVDRQSCDLRDAAAISSLFDRFPVSAVINAAAYTQVDRAETDASICWEVNVTAVERLTLECARRNLPLVQISSDYVFGGDASRRSPYLETDSPAPQGVYARSKLAGEQAAARNPRHLIVRTCGLYLRSPAGPIRGKNFVDTMLVLARDRSTLRIVNDQWCTPSYVPHVAQAIAYLLRREAWGTFHVVNQGATTWFDFAAEIFRLAELPMELVPISAAEYGAPAPRPGYSVLSTAKYHALGGPPLPDWRAGLASYFSVRE